MSTVTENLGLFQYDPVADAGENFNIQQALNENWAKLDTFAAGAVTTESLPDVVATSAEVAAGMVNDKLMTPANTKVGYFGKAESLTAATAVAYKLTADATPNQALAVLAGSPVIVTFLDDTDSPAGGVLVRISKGGSSKSLTTGVDGTVMFDGDLYGYGTYTLVVTVPASPFYTGVSQTVTTVHGTVQTVTLRANRVLAGEVKQTSSRTVNFPAWVLFADLFAGGGGVVGPYAPDYRGYGGGGGSGYTITILNVSVANTVVTLVVGRGGVGIIDLVGGDGGDSKVTVNGVVLITAKGGKGGTSPYHDGVGQGGDGGSGGGAPYALGGENGSNGDDSIYTPKPKGGKGQGTTTKAFGEPDGEQFAFGGDGEHDSDGTHPTRVELCSGSSADAGEASARNGVVIFRWDVTA